MSSIFCAHIRHALGTLTVYSRQWGWESCRTESVVLQHFTSRGAARIRTGDRGFAVLCLTTWPRRLNARRGDPAVCASSLPIQKSGKPDSNRRLPPWQG